MAQTKSEIDARYYKKNKEAIKAKYPHITIAEISNEQRLQRNEYQRKQHRIRKMKKKGWFNTKSEFQGVVMNVLDLFSGIGGFSLGLERAGFETVAFCEIEKFPQKVLKKHWPEVPCYDDVREITNERLVSDGIGRVDVITGGFPCQDLSVAGNQKGIHAERSGLWSELCRIIGDIRPRYAIVENVTALISGDNGRWFGKVLGDLAQIGYDAEWHCIPASSIGAPHIRDRIWIIAYPQCCVRPQRLLAREYVETSKRRNSSIWRTNRKFTQMASVAYKIYKKRMDKSKSNRVDDGVQDWAYRLKATGNAVVPQIPELIGRAIMEYEQTKP